MSDDLPPKSYFVGLLDSLSRVQFNIRRNSDNTFSTRPSLRIKHRDDEILISLIGELLESKDISFDLISREYGYNYFHINRREDLKTIHNYIDYESTQLVRELAFTHGPYEEHFGSANSPKGTYRLIQAIEDLHFDYRLSPKRPYPELEELASEFDIDVSDIDKLEIPVGSFRENYPVEYIGGIVDGRAYFKVAIGKSSHGLGYSMVPQIPIRRGAVHPAYSTAVEVFCDNEKLRYNATGDMQTMHTIINGADAIGEFASVVGPYLIAKRDDLAYIHQELIPRFEAGKHHNKQGFYDLLVEFQALNTNRQTRKGSQKFTPEFFEEAWKGEINIRNETN